ncbi:MAG TPA: alpha-amylase family glycosyl hydrolase [Chitinophagaceae bacterium]
MLNNETPKQITWAASTNIYEVNTRQYTVEGTFNAFAQSLTRLRDMGVETLWFMPIQPVGEKNRKGTLGSYYSISDYKAINPEFGTLDDFKRLVKEAQGMGFKVIIDWVANHTSWDHVWTVSHPEFYTKDSDGNFRPPFPDWADVIDLDYDNRELWTAMIEDMKYWVNETGIDGFRCDMAHLVPLEFWKEARKELDAIRPLFWLAETEEPNYHEAFDASYTWEFLHKMEAYWRKETDIEGLDAVLYKYDAVFPSTAIRMFFTSNHDENSHSGTEYDRMGDAAKAFAVLSATWNGIPLIYSGQELPNKKKLAFFEKDAIEWTGVNDLHKFYKALLSLHATHPALRAADANVRTYRIKTTADENVFAFLRKSGEKEVLVILNLSPNDISFEITDENIKTEFINQFSQAHYDFDTSRVLVMKPWDYIVYVK